MCLFLFEHELRLHLTPVVGNPDLLHKIAVRETHMSFFWKLGTTDVANIMFDCVDNGLGLRVKKYVAQKSPQFWQKVNLMQENLHVPLLIAFIFGHYIDIFKDVFLASDFSQFLRGRVLYEPFSLTLFLLMVFSIVSGLFANIIIVMTFEYWSWKQKLFGCIFIVLAPAAVQYRIFRLKSTLIQSAKTCRDEEEISIMRRDLETMVYLKARFRANENILEHFIQLTILFTLSLIKDSKTTTAPPHIAKYVVETSGFFLFASSAWSYISLVRGQINLTSSKKYSFVPFVGKIILVIYFTLGTGARVCSLLLYFTPSLGLFNSLHHPAFATKGATTEYAAVFNISVNGTPIWFNELWNNHFREGPHEFYVIPSDILIFVLLLLVLAHLIASWHIQRKLYWRVKLGIPEHFFNALYTIICPPLSLDWEGIYRNSGGTLSIPECQKRSAKTIIALQVKCCLFISSSGSKFRS